MVENGDLVEIQATGEKGLLRDRQLLQMLTYARNGTEQIFEMQKNILLSK